MTNTRYRLSSHSVGVATYPHHTTGDTMPFLPGDPKPPASGRKRGTKNKSKARITKALKSHGADLEKALAEAILDKDVDLIKALTPLVAYIASKPRPDSEEEATTKPAKKSKSKEERLALIHGINKPS